MAVGGENGGGLQHTQADVGCSDTAQSQAQEGTQRWRLWWLLLVLLMLLCTIKLLHALLHSSKGNPLL